MDKATTRIEKYKEYRHSFMKEDAKAPASFDTEMGQSKTLPMDTVLSKESTVDPNVLKYQQQKKKQTRKYIILTLIAAALILGVVIFALLVFKE